MRSVIFPVALALLFSSCLKGKKPVPKICPELPKKIKVGDTLVLTNCSENYLTQRWLLPGNATSTDEKIYFSSPTKGNFPVTLYVKNDNRVNEYEISGNIIVE